MRLNIDERRYLRMARYMKDRAKGLRRLAILGKVLTRASLRFDGTLTTCVLGQLLRWLTVGKALIDSFR
jgi:hypothetical protein